MGRSYGELGKGGVDIFVGWRSESLRRREDFGRLRWSLPVSLVEQWRLSLTPDLCIPKREELATSFA